MEEVDAAGDGDQWTVSKVTNPGKELLEPQPLRFPLFLVDYGKIHQSPESRGVGGQAGPGRPQQGPNQVLLSTTESKQTCSFYKVTS